jgi:hypothetical protein
MRKEEEDDDDNWKITMKSRRWCTYVHTRLSMCSSLSLPMSLFFVFQKTACAQAHHMCYRRAHPFFSSSSSSSSSSLPDMFYNHTNTTCRCMCTSKEDEQRERENERRKEIEYWMCIMMTKRRMLRFTSFFFLVTGYEKNEDVKKDVFFSLFFCLIYTCPSSSSLNTHSSQILGSFS